jgi:hypothetical protein
MDEKQLIEKIESLKTIKPRKEWVVFAKSELFEEERVIAEQKIGFKELLHGLKFMFSHKYAFSTIAVVLILTGTFGFALKTVPGDTLFAVKKALEQSQAVFLPQSDKLEFDLAQANKRLEDLTKIAGNKDSRKLAPAIDEYQASVSEVAKNLATETDKTKLKEIVSKVKELEIREKEIKSLGVELGENADKDITLIGLITNEINKLEADNISSEQRSLLIIAQAKLEKGEIADALDIILELNNPESVLNPGSN